jgi:ABC-2 type transport system ATP-binding protein
VIGELVAEGMTLLLTTQYLEEAERLADDIVVIDHGKVIARGDSRSLKRLVGGDQVQVVVGDTAHIDITARVVVDVTGNEPHVDVAARTVTAPTSKGVETLVLVAGGLTAAGVAVDDLSLRQPTLDEVFLTLTGSPADDLVPQEAYS